MRHSAHHEQSPGSMVLGRLPKAHGARGLSAVHSALTVEEMTLRGTIWAPSRRGDRMTTTDSRPRHVPIEELVKLPRAVPRLPPRRQARCRIHPPLHGTVQRATHGMTRRSRRSRLRSMTGSASSPMAGNGWRRCARSAPKRGASIQAHGRNCACRPCKCAIGVRCERHL